MGAHHAESVEQCTHWLCGHLRAAIGVHDGLAGFDTLSFQRLRDEMFGKFRVGASDQHPANHESAENVQHYQQGEPLAFVRSAYLGDVPTENLTRTCSQQFGPLIFGMPRNAPAFAYLVVGAQ